VRKKLGHGVFWGCSPPPYLLETHSDQRCGIGIDDGTVEQAQSLEEVVTESVVRRFEILKLLWTEAPQKSPQSVAMRKVGKTQDRWDQALWIKH
jgi:hypothetical protein